MLRELLKQDELLPLLAVAVVFFVVSLVGTVVSATRFVSLLSLMFAIFAYLVLPGYFVLLNFKLSSLERIIFGMPVSITVVSIFLYVIDIIGFAISARNILLIIFFVCVASIFARKKFGVVDSA